MVSMDVAYYENVPGIANSVQQRLFCCRDCLIKRFGNRALFSRKELFLREFMTNLKLSRLAKTIHQWPPQHRAILGHSYHVCWECGDHVGTGTHESKYGAGSLTSLARCLDTPLKNADRLFCRRCATRYGQCGDECSFCAANPYRHIIAHLGLRVCGPCIDHFIHDLSPDARVELAASIRKKRRFCLEHGEYFGDRCLKDRTEDLREPHKDLVRLPKRVKTDD